MLLRICILHDVDIECYNRVKRPIKQVLKSDPTMNYETAPSTKLVTTEQLTTVSQTDDKEDDKEDDKSG